MRLLTIALISAIFLSGCANVATTKHNPQGKIGSVVLTPTGAFPAKKELAAVYEDKAFQLMTESIKAQLPVKYKQNLVVNKRAEMSASFNDWFNADQVNLSGMQGLGDDALLIDYGFQGFSLKDYYDQGVLVAEATIGILFIDPKTGKVVGRARVFGVGNSIVGDSMGVNGELVARLKANQSASQVPMAEVDAAFQRLINRLVGNAIRKITD